MPLLADRVRETSATTGTGTLTLAGAVAGYQGFNAAFANADTVYYVIHYATEWEVGIGTVGTGTLARNTVLASSNANALVPFSAGTKDVFCAYVAGRAVTTSDAATLTYKTIDDYTNDVGANSTHFRIKANGTIGKGAVIKATGFVPGEQAIEVGLVASATDTAIGIMEQALTVGQFGMAVVIGELFTVNTNAFAFNDVLYSNGSGGLTATKPSSGTYQTLGTVVRANTNNGVIAVNIVAPQFVEVSTNTANTTVLRDGSGNFAAGTITAALTGNASTATALATARNINGVSFNGTADITVTAAAGTLSGSTLASGVTASSLTSVGTLTALTVSGNTTLATSSGNVNVGAAVTSTTWGKFVGVQAAYPGIVLDSTAPSGRKFSIGVDATQWYLRDETATATRFLVDASGNLVVDTNTLFVDAVNNRVGVGTVTPDDTFHVFGNALATGTAGSYPRFISTVGAKSWELGYRSGTSLFELREDGTTRIAVSNGGNLGLGVTPSAWGSGYTAMQLRTGALFGTASRDFTIGANVFVNASAAFAYTETAQATAYTQYQGTHAWYTAPSGTAGNAISFTQAMTLDASGRLGIGETSPAQRVVVRDTSSAPYVSFIAGASSAMGLLMGTSGNTVDGQIVYSNSTQAMTFVTASTERARIDASGNLGVGTTPTNYGAGYTQFVLRGSTIPIVDLTVDTTRTLSILAQAAQSTIKTVTNTPLILATNDTNRVSVPAIGGMVVGTAALATSATDGFLYVPTCAGTPTGTPTTQTGTAPIIVDTTNHKLYFFSGGTWRDAGP